MDFSNYIYPELLIIVPVLCFLGCFIKCSKVVYAKRIPLILAGAGVAMALLWVLSQVPESVFAAAFTAIVQGILCAGTAVYAHQLIKQGGKQE